MLKISLDALELLDAIERGGSLAAAAKEMHRVPSTVSYAVSKLEDDLGVQIFDRAGGRLALTETGRALLADGRELLIAARHLQHKVARIAKGWEAEFTIGMDLLFPPSLLIDEIAAFYDANDSTRLRITQEALSGTWEALLDRRVDLLLGAAGEGPSGVGYVAEPIGSLEFIFAVAPAHPLAAVNRPLTRADLLAHRVVSVADTARRLPPRTVGLQVGQDTVTVPDLRCKLAFQVAGLGVGFLPKPLALPALHAGLLIEKPVEEQRPPEDFFLAWRSGEQGAALRWWRQRLRHLPLIDRLSDIVQFHHP